MVTKNTHNEVKNELLELMKIKSALDEVCYEINVICCIFESLHMLNIQLSPYAYTLNHI